MAADPRLRQVPFFDGLDDDDLERICEGVEDVTLAAGEVLFSEGDEGDAAYVVTSGEIEVLRAMAHRDVRLAMRSTGDVIGEMALIYQEPRSATLRAKSASTALRIPRSAFDGVLDTSPKAARRMFQTLGARLRETHREDQQNERMAQLGTLAVGIAHELNNPAAGVQRAAQQLRDELEGLAVTLAGTAGGDPIAATTGRQAALPVLVTLAGRRVETATLSTLAKANLEDEVETWLDDSGIDNSWALAPSLVDAGVRVTDLDDLPGDVEVRTAAIRFLVTASRLQLLSESIIEGTTRLSGIVGALKRHNYTDQAPIVDVDVVRGIEDTLILLGHKVKQVTVERDHGTDVGTIVGYGSDLNQVWTNLIDNACDAMLDAGTAGPTLTVRTRRDGDEIVVSIGDNGPGIPTGVQERIFDAFFTTKEPGKGTGLGMQISARIVMEHEGDLTLESSPGATWFHVRLPAQLQKTGGAP